MHNSKKPGIMISLCDYTGIMAKPWLEAGYHAMLIDPQHEPGVNVEQQPSGALLYKVGHELDHEDAWDALNEAIRARVAPVVFVAGFPVCTDLAASGALHWQAKFEKDRHFQARAMKLVHECRVVGEISQAPWMMENPVSALATIYRKPDYKFNPCDYGGYLPPDDVHPQYPEYFPPQDAYGKLTCLWTGGGFIMPPKRPVPIAKGQKDGQGQSKAHNKLGGKSDKTKNIRSATPRGFAQAVFEYNQPLEEE